VINHLARSNGGRYDPCPWMSQKALPRDLGSLVVPAAKSLAETSDPWGA
jgi:hypothetical protein